MHRVRGGEAPDEFYRRTQGQLYKHCKACTIAERTAYVQGDGRGARNVYMRRYLADLQSGVRPSAGSEFLREEKAKPCTDCGGTFPQECMQFDHVRGTKILAVGNMRRCSLERLKAEVAKCELVCSNCHATRTHQRRQETTS